MFLDMRPRSQSIHWSNNNVHEIKYTSRKNISVVELLQSCLFCGPWDKNWFPGNCIRQSVTTERSPRCRWWLLWMRSRGRFIFWVIIGNVVLAAITGTTIVMFCLTSSHYNSFEGTRWWNHILLNSIRLLYWQCIMLWYIYGHDRSNIFILYHHNNDVIWATWRLKPPATRSFVQQLLRANGYELITRIL